MSTISHTLQGTTNRQGFLRGLAGAGAGLALAGGLAPFTAGTSIARADAALPKGDKDILVAASIAEALAVTTYTTIVNSAPFFKNLAADDQGYLKAARHEEMSHYLLEVGVTGMPSPYTMFYYPKNMFASAKVTLNTLVTLEDAFIAAYLIGVKDFSTPDLRVIAARIMGIESDHRTLARVVAPNVAMADGGPIERITGLQGEAEKVDPPNNNGYERTLGLNTISQAVTAMLPFVDAKAAAKAGFDTSKSYKFQSFTPRLPEQLGQLNGLAG